MSIISIKATEKCIVYKLRSLVIKSLLPRYHRATIFIQIRAAKSLLRQIKASFDRHNPDDNEI